MNRRQLFTGALAAWAGRRPQLARKDGPRTIHAITFTGNWIRSNFGSVQQADQWLRLAGAPFGGRWQDGDGHILVARDVDNPYAENADRYDAWYSFTPWKIS